jgi:hypothetical protein
MIIFEDFVTGRQRKASTPGAAYWSLARTATIEQKPRIMPTMLKAEVQPFTIFAVDSAMSKYRYWCMHNTIKQVQTTN